MLVSARKISVPIACAIALLGFSRLATAQHPVEVQQSLAKSEYFDALKIYYTLPLRRISNDTRVAAGRSAWALSLPKEAISEFDEVLRDPKVVGDERAEITLMRGVIEFQEGRFADANLYAEKAVDLVQQSPELRARALMLWGQALLRTKAYGAAEEKFAKALAEAGPDDLPEVHYWAGNVRYKLGQFENARKDFESIPMHHDRTPFAIRYLARIALDTHEYKSAQFWLTKGRSEYPEQFLDSWVDYALVQVASEAGDSHAVDAELEKIRKDYPASDPWVPLVEAEAELGAWRARMKDSTLTDSNIESDRLGGNDASN